MPTKAIASQTIACFEHILDLRFKDHFNDRMKNCDIPRIH